MRVSIKQLLKKKKDGIPISMLTAYDGAIASLIDATSVDMILVGDSLGNVVAGFDSTIPVTMDHMVYHTQMVSRSTTRVMIVADMPFMSYQVSLSDAKRNAARLLQEGGANALKIEVMGDDVSVIREIINCGIPVIGHLGLTPQAVHQLGGYKMQGRDDDAERVYEKAIELQDAGCFALLLEMVPESLAMRISDKLDIPVIGIGAGKCDGQVLVTHDMLGLTTGKVPRFVKQYAHLSDTIKDAIHHFVTDVETRKFPSSETTIE